ncbi:hypothetical protein ZIOFF_048311 [Zingiber officinale]|uniref:Transposase n=1 Tax=Zingiber officinale TaxID=94328 RepID=A0A8J5FT36_ZINOF|nr:hypothetical protein ZIOFF_048311 [Zingiber officinale]
MLPRNSDGKLECKCNKCGAKYVADSKSDTGNLHRHIKKCVRMTTKEIGQYIIAMDEGPCLTTRTTFSQDKFRELVVHAILRHDLPFSFVEYEGMWNIFKYLEPRICHFSRNTVKSDIKKIYGVEFNRLCTELLACPGRICLTSDAWTSIATDGYLSLTAHYVNKNWVLQKRILNFSYIPPPHTGVALAEKIYSLACDWGIEKKLFSITLDNASANDVCVEILKTQLRLKNALIFDGTLFHVRCCAHILNLIVQDGLKEIDIVVDKIREFVKYVKGSQGRKEKFKNFVQLQKSGKELKKICGFLEVFHNATVDFSGSRYPTSNLYFPHVFVIQLKLHEESSSQDLYMKKIADQMFVKFNKYWCEFNVLFVIAVIFNPQYKFQFVKFSYGKLYGSGSRELMKVRETLFGIFGEYMKDSNTSPASSSHSQGSKEVNALTFQDDISKESSNVFKEFDEFEDFEFAISAQKSQLEMYLDEPRSKRTSSINVLEFWRSQQFRYPELAKLARDVLAVPVSTVASESAFSLGGRILDQYRSSMSPQVVEALICSRDWLFGENYISLVKLEDVTQDIMALHLNKGEAESSLMEGGVLGRSQNKSCSSSCGILDDIGCPFRLQSTDFICESGKDAVLHKLSYTDKYLVTEISYNQLQFKLVYADYVTGKCWITPFLFLLIRSCTFSSLLHIEVTGLEKKSEAVSSLPCRAPPTPPSYCRASDSRSSPPYTAISTPLCAPQRRRLLAGTQAQPSRGLPLPDADISPFPPEPRLLLWARDTADSLLPVPYFGFTVSRALLTAVPQTSISCALGLDCAAAEFASPTLCPNIFTGHRFDPSQIVGSVP